MEIRQNNDVLTIESIPTSGYKFIHAVQKITTSEITLEDYTFTENVSDITLTKDSYYLITEVKLPDSVTPNNYYILGSIIYNPLGEVISVSDLLNTDITDTNIIKESDEILFYYYLNKYYVDLIQSKIFKNIFSCDCLESKEDKLIIDTLTMGLEVLRTLEQYNQYYEAQRILEKLSTCNGNVPINCGCNA